MKTFLAIHRKKLLVIASIIMVLILGIPLYGCDDVDTSNVVEENVDDMVLLEDWDLRTGSKEIIVNAPNDDMAVGYYFFTEIGRFRLDTFKQEKELTVPAKTVVHWTTYFRDEDTAKFYIEIIKKRKVENKTSYLGYAVIQVTKASTYNGDEYTPKVLKSVVFPEIDGKEQVVTPDQVYALIKKAKE